MEAMQQELNHLRENMHQAESLHAKVQGMFEDGVLKHDHEGNIQPVMDDSERESIRAQIMETKRR